MSHKNLIFSIVLALIFTWFAIANLQIVTVSFLIWNFMMSLSLVILLSILLGILITGIVSVAEQAKLMRRIKGLEKKEKELDELTGKTTKPVETT